MAPGVSNEADHTLARRLRGNGVQHGHEDACHLAAMPTQKSSSTYCPVRFRRFQCRHRSHAAHLHAPLQNPFPRSLLVSSHVEMTWALVPLAGSSFRVTGRIGVEAKARRRRTAGSNSRRSNAGIGVEAVEEHGTNLRHEVLATPGAQTSSTHVQHGEPTSFPAGTFLMRSYPGVTVRAGPGWVSR